MPVGRSGVFGTLLALALCGPAATASSAPQDDAPVEVSLAGGVITGERVGDALAFRGVRYAMAPTGSRRWRPPRALVGDDSKPLQSDAVACPQPGPERLEVPVAEDCLQLNVWTPALDGSRPVMVWIHGGGFLTGTGASSVYDGGHFARDGAVLVTINYRLGALGFLAHPALLDEPAQSAAAPSGVANFGLLDMIEALRWVRRHIADLGGDPQRVTIFGESAGGMAVQLLLSSPGAAGLFDRAVSMSGYGTWPLPRTDGRGQPSQDARRLASRIAAAAGAAPAAGAEELRALPVQALVDATRGLHLPVVDGVTLPEEPGAIFEAGRHHRVPTIFGGNSYDGAVLLMAGMSPSAYLDSWSQQQRQEIFQLYGSDRAVSEDQVAIRLFGDARYLLASRTLARAASRHGGEAYLYYFAYLPTSLRSRWPGAPHAVEVAMLFGNAHPLSGKVDDEWLRVSRQLRGDFVRFAGGAPPDDDWPAYGADRLWRVYGTSPVSRAGVIESRLDFLEEWYRSRRRALVSGAADG